MGTMTVAMLGISLNTQGLLMIYIYWDITPCSFRGTYRLHLQGGIISEAGSKQSPACYLLHAGFLFGLFFDPEDVGDRFLLNVY
jgi:hypothetical protein